jgi:hypothetical protein
MENYRTVIVQRSLSAQVDHVDKIQCHNLFHIFFVVNNCRVLNIIDGGSCNNLVNSVVVKKLGLTTRAHPHPYNIQWFNNSGKVKVTPTARVHFSIGSYHVVADFNVVPMDACSFLLDTLGSLMLMLFTMVELILTLSCIRARKLLWFQ